MMDQNRGSSYIPGRMDVIIKLTQKRMTFKGRATGQITEQIVQDPATGLIQIQPATDDAKTSALIRQIMNQLGPTASQNAVARELAAALGVSKATADRRLKALVTR